MRPSFLLLFLSVLTLGLSSCGLFGGGGEDPAAEAPPPEPVAAAPQTTPTEGEAPAEVFPEEEPQAEEPPAPPPPQSALEQSTNSEQRVQSVGNTTGKKDPFNPPGIIVTGGSGTGEGGPAGGVPEIVVATPPPPTPPPPPNNAAGGGGSGPGRGVPAIPKIAPLSIPELPQVEPPPNLGINPRFRPVVAQAPFDPGPPPPNTARAVEVSAVVQVGQTVKAIVKSPGEDSQYVGVGEYIGGGSVYVKDINVYAPAEPVVILEEFGQEVARAVGAAPLPEIAAPTPPGGGSEETTIRGIKVSELKLTGSTLLGKVKNDSDEPVQVKQLTLRFETKDGVLVGTTSVGGPNGVLTPGQEGFVRRLYVDTFGLPADQLTVKFEDWE
ncbi:hypothetical protein PMG71_11865 [Roseofilum sp. BLCC_M154]|uniref:Uncharacterized protein n=1 Tax=Roseofilum acuticapitatum BLCC-M154 TaxID=3022444 RepID=A0ABT7ATA1_9CYAN|nr:hypothetical protein [Roseofilum acuticapitatum]MDJ1170126.1 hypothetical protein [Roseofilum acuticapitatum BLCC-M154]